MSPARTAMPGAETLGALLTRRGPGTDGATVTDAPETRGISPAAQAQGICLRLLTTRSRSRAELADALRGRGVPDEVSASVLDRLTAVGLVDDAAFAESAVHCGHYCRGLGRRALSTELRGRGVPEEIAREAVATVRPEDEEVRARELVRRKLRDSTVREASKLARKLVGILARKGYSEGLVRRVVRDELGPGDWAAEVESCSD